MTPEETGINIDFLQRLIGKLLQIHGTMTPSEIAKEVCLSPPVVASIVQGLMRLQLVEARGLAGNDVRSELRYVLGANGRAWALESMALSSYIGPAPVTLDDFTKQIRSQSILRERISRPQIIEGLSHLVLPENLIDQLGPAVNSGRSLLLYGDSGNGKTSIAEAVGSFFREIIFIPHCIEVGGQIINFFDATIHKPVSEFGEDTEQSNLLNSKFDARWIPIHRPIVMTGGELTLEMLDLIFNSNSNFYEAPTHLKAAGGIFVVDDFGRQRTNSQAFLNRWIIPLERGHDYLTLHTGKKFAVPFDQLVIFSTNIEPVKLADTAGLRRLVYKIFIPSPTSADFKLIFERACKAGEIPFDEEAYDTFFRNYYQTNGAILSGAHPKYIVDYIKAICSYRGVAPLMTAETLDTAWSNLHVRSPV
ncbi:MAG: AAA family ATPase [Alphaproteobacteria bacterium]